MKSPTLTVISVVRNDLDGLVKTMGSVADEIPDAEHLIIDGSDAPLLTAPWRSGVRVNVYRDRGIAHAFNRGILEATGRYLMFLNAGDCFVDGAGSVITQSLNDSISDCLWFPVFRVSMDGVRSLYLPRLRYLKYAMSAPHQGMIVKREVFAEIGLFPLQRYAMDHHLALRFMSRQPSFSIDCQVNPIVTYPSGGHSTLGGGRPFIANCWNTMRLAPRHFPVAVLANAYLYLKTVLTS